MADDDGFAAPSGASSSDDLAAAIALAAQGTLDPRAADYLAEQTVLAKLQSQNLIEQNAFEVSHLKWRRFNDRLRGAWQTLAMLIGAVVVSGIAGLIWSAHDATGLVVQPLSAPPDFAARGLDGTVLAQRLLDKLNGLVQQSEAYSVRSADSIGGNWGEDSKVEIPQTGVSIVELSRALRAWLGSETRVSGEVWRTPEGVAISVRAGANPGVEFSGKEADLEKLLDAAALTLLEQTQPFRYANLYMDSRKGDRKKALAIYRRLAAISTGRERAWALVEIGLAGLGPAETLAVTNEAIRLDPGNPLAWSGRLSVNASLGHGEAVVQDLQQILNVIAGRLPPDVLTSAVETVRLAAEASLRESKGAFAEAAAFNLEQEQRNSSGQLDWIEAASNLARAHDGSAARTLLAQNSAVAISDAFTHAAGKYLLPPQVILEMDAGDWQVAARDLQFGDQTLQASARNDDVRHTLVWPWLAWVWARSGELGKAKDLIARTPHDCTLCLEMRGRIAEAARDPKGAAFWYARAVDDAPSVPFAAFDWGVMLLSGGRHEQAIEKFRMANARGPRFADPLEKWGEVLMLQKRSDLALEKFEEAASYASNWGRLHLKWGEALRYAGNKVEAKKQFAIASSLDLTTSEESELADVLNRV